MNPVPTLQPHEPVERLRGRAPGKIRPVTSSPGCRSRRILLSTLAATLVLLLVAAAEGSVVETGWKRLQVPSSGSYLWRYVPPAVDFTRPLPVIVFLHGSGSSPEAWLDTLSPEADALGFIAVAPRSVSHLAFGIGADERTIFDGLDLLRQELPVDDQRIGIAGHSAGGAYAAVLAYAVRSRFAGVFTLGAPYRIVIERADPDHAAPIRMYYGSEDPNYRGGVLGALSEQWERLGIPVKTEVQSGFGHNSWPETTLRDGFSFLLAQRYRTPGSCVPSDRRLCLRGGRFAVEAEWRDFAGHTGRAGVAEAATADSGLLYFFSPGNWELQVKVLDGCRVNDHYWVFAAGTTNVAFTLRVTDLETDESAVYDNPLGRIALTVADTTAFSGCP